MPPEFTEQYPSKRKPVLRARKGSGSGSTWARKDKLGHGIRFLKKRVTPVGSPFSNFWGLTNRFEPSLHRIQKSGASSIFLITTHTMDPISSIRKERCGKTLQPRGGIGEPIFP
jgi:hypothetical protein